MLRRLAPLLLAPLRGSRQPPEIAVRAVFVGPALAFVAADRGGSDAAFCWSEATVVDVDSDSPAAAALRQRRWPRQGAETAERPPPPAGAGA
ncbi:MAG: hypothetical protein ACXW27_13070 [Allosphingosinicella sp.]